MIIHKEYALRRFCELPLKNKFSRVLLEKIWTTPDLLGKLVFVKDRDYLPNTMLFSQAGSNAPGFELQLSNELEYLSLVNGTLVREKRRTDLALIKDPLDAWKVLQEFTGLLHVELVFNGPIPDWYGEVAVPNEAVPCFEPPPGFTTFIREQIDLILWGITLKEQIDKALKDRDEEMFKALVPLYKEVCKSCFWKLP